MGTRTGLYVETRPTGRPEFPLALSVGRTPDKLVLGPVMVWDPRRKILPDLGVAPAIGSPLSLEEARWLNALVRRQVASGIDPKGQRRHTDAGFTVKAVGEEYLKRHGHLRGCSAGAATTSHSSTPHSDLARLPA